MPFPNFAGKHAHDAMFAPHDLLAYLRQSGTVAAFDPLDGIIFTYQDTVLAHLLATEETEVVPLFAGGELHLWQSGAVRIGVCGRFGIGAPAAASLLEQFVALGTRRFVSIGTAGGLRPGARAGDLIVCDGAVRDEGVSHHYLPPAERAHPSPALTDELKRALDGLGMPYAVGPAWTIDAPYRETVEEARHYQAAGVLAVEMEAAALFAVAAVRGVDLAAAFVVSDSLAELAWDPQFAAEPTRRGLVTLYEAARAALGG